MQHTASHTTAVLSTFQYQWYILIVKQWYQLPEFIPSQFKFWSPPLHQHLRLHSACHLNNKTYPLTPDLHCHQYLHLCVLYRLPDSSNLCKQMTSSHCTCYLLYHYISCVPTSDNEYTVLNYYWCLYHSHHMAILHLLRYLVPFSTNHKLGFIHIYSHASVLHVTLPLINPFNQIIFSLSYHNQVICLQ